MIRRLATATLALALALGATGCQPETNPAQPVFESEAEAFAAAEETYRAYVDALNQVDLSDPETFEAVYAWTTGDANANERTTFSQMHADGWQVSGATKILSITGESAELAEVEKVEAIICSDVTEVEVVDADGQSVVSDQRPDVYALAVEFVSSSITPTGLQISTSNAVEDSSCT